MANHSPLRVFITRVQPSHSRDNAVYDSIVETSELCHNSLRHEVNSYGGVTQDNKVCIQHKI